MEAGVRHRGILFAVVYLTIQNGRNWKSREREDYTGNEEAQMPYQRILIAALRQQVKEARCVNYSQGHILSKKKISYLAQFILDDAKCSNF